MTIEFSFAINNLNREELKSKLTPLLENKSSIFKKYSFHEMDSLEDYRFELEGKEGIYVLSNAYYNPAAQNDAKIITTKTGASFALPAFDMQESDVIKAIQCGGSPIGYFDLNSQILYLPYSIKDFSEAERLDIIVSATESLYEQYLSQQHNPNSWYHHADRLKGGLEKMLQKDHTQEIKQANQQVERSKQQINEYTEKLKLEFDKVKENEQKVVFLENAKPNFENFYNGLDQIAGYPNVSEVLVVGDIVTVHVDKVYAYAPFGKEERRFYIGNMKIQMNIANTEIKFFGDNPRKSHWSKRDPHPHVSGESGGACLGNVSTTIAELCSQLEVFPLFLVCLDFLQNANPSDTAGKNVVRWDQVDEDGKVIKKGHNPQMFRCDRCEDRDEANEDPRRQVYTRFDPRDADNNRSEMWCADCYDDDDDITWVDELNAYVRDDIHAAVRAHFDANPVAAEAAQEATPTTAGEAR